MSDSVAALIAETRARREALHELIARLRRDHDSWRLVTAGLASRARLTAPQREAFHRYLQRRRRNA